MMASFLCGLEAKVYSLQGWPQEFIKEIFLDLIV